MLSLKTFSLLLGLCTYHFTSSALSVGALQEETECGRVINDESQARECLNVVDLSINPPSPVVLEATVEDNFICKDKPVLYSFSCTLYGYDLVWHFDDEIVAHFLPNDTAGGEFRVFQYPQSAPLYNITAVLTQVSEATVSRYNAPFCVSVLTVQPFNESEIQVLPFTVSCQTHCEDDNRTAICRTRHYDVAAKPSQPSETSGNIQTILDNERSEAGNGIGAIASLNWNPPENHNQTAIDFYELTVIGTPTNSNTFFYRTTEQQKFSSKYVLPEGNYTAVRITAVDLCEQRSEPSQVMLKNINNPPSIGTTTVTVDFTTTADSAINSELDELNNTIEDKQRTIDILAGILAFAFAVIIAIIIIIATLIIVCKRGSCGRAEINGKNNDIQLPMETMY